MQEYRTGGRNLAISAAMKRAYIKTREQAEEITNRDNESAESYAYNQAESNSQEAVAVGVSVVHTAADIVRGTKNYIQGHRNSAEAPESKPDAVSMPKTAEKASRIKTRETVQPVRYSMDSKPSTAVRTSSVAKTAGRTRTANRTSAQIVTAGRKNAAAVKAANDSKRAAEFAKQTAEKSKKLAKAAAKALKAAIKGAIEGTKSLVAAICAGGWVAVVIIIIICLVGLIVSSAYGIFAGNEVSKSTDGDTSRDLRAAVSTINSEYYQKIQNIRNSVENLENTTIYINGEVGAMAGVWQDVLAVYAVDTAHGKEATLAIDFDSSKTSQLEEVFWNMVSISHKVTERTVEEEQETTDENGETVTETVEVIYRDLTIYVKTQSASQAAQSYSFDEEQNKVLTELMSDDFTQSWSDLIYGYSYGDENIVAVAISQIGNIGGEPYWRWYGLSSRTEWCAIFVSWCADQCGYLDSGVIPKFAWVPDAVSWFQARGQWQPRGYTPAPGDIIFFDWEGDGGANHVGIVEYVENGVVHTVEGNSGDACKRKEYAVDSPNILGYGIPIYS